MQKRGDGAHTGQLVLCVFTLLSLYCRRHKAVEKENSCATRTWSRVCVCVLTPANMHIYNYLYAHHHRNVFFNFCFLSNTPKFTDYTLFTRILHNFPSDCTVLARMFVYTSTVVLTSGSVSLGAPAALMLFFGAALAYFM